MAAVKHLDLPSVLQWELMNHWS